MAVSARASRFAVLKIEDDDDEVQATQKKRQPVKTANNQNQTTKQKKQKKGKKKPTEAPGQQLFQMTEEQWAEWKEKDSEFVSEAYLQDLQSAILMSKEEYETNKQTYQRRAAQAQADTNERKRVEEEEAKSKKQKKKEKQAMKNKSLSLDEFQTGVSSKERTNPVPQHNNDKPRKVGHVIIDPEPEEKLYFDAVENEAHKIINKENAQARLKVSIQQESAMANKFQHELDLKQEEIDGLRKELDSMKSDFGAVKKRNKQLCFILAQGEMKEKSDILLQVDELTHVKDELTQQVSELAGFLEKERSEVHRLRSEMQKHQHVTHKINGK